jgi:hypothetical protein
VLDTIGAQLAVSRPVAPPLQFVVLPHAPLLALMPVVTYPHTPLAHCELLVQTHAVLLVLGVPTPHVYEVGVDGSRSAQSAVSRLVVPPLQAVVLPHAVLLALAPVVT